MDKPGLKVSLKNEDSLPSQHSAHYSIHTGHADYLHKGNEDLLNFLDKHPIAGKTGYFPTKIHETPKADADFTSHYDLFDASTNTQHYSSINSYFWFVPTNNFSTGVVHDVAS